MGSGPAGIVCSHDATDDIAAHHMLGSSGNVSPFGHIPGFVRRTGRFWRAIRVTRL